MPAGIKLREANQQQQFNRNVEDIELWLYEVEGHLASDDYGKDLTSVQNLQKKQALLEADVAAHQVKKRHCASLSNSLNVKLNLLHYILFCV